MTEEGLDLSVLENAIGQIEQSLIFAKSDVVKQHEGLDVQIRSAAIQAFEFSFELCVRFIERYLRLFESDEILRMMPYREIIRTAASRGFDIEPKQWFEFRKERNLTSHTYSEENADKVYAIVPDFLREAKKLLGAL